MLPLILILLIDVTFSTPTPGYVNDAGLWSSTCIVRAPAGKVLLVRLRDAGDADTCSSLLRLCRRRIAFQRPCSRAKAKGRPLVCFLPSLPLRDVRIAGL